MPAQQPKALAPHLERLIFIDKFFYASVAATRLLSVCVCDTISRFSIGATLSLASLPIAWVVSSFVLTQDFNFAGWENPRLDHLVAKTGSLLQKNVLLNSSLITAISHAQCPMKEWVKKTNDLVQHDLSLKQTVSDVKSKLFWEVAKEAIVDEIKYRGIIQGMALPYVTKHAVKLIVAGKEAKLDSIAAKITRVVLTAALSTFPFVNPERGYTDSDLTILQISTFAMAVIFGVLKESKMGLLSSIGANMAYRFAELTPLLGSC